MRWHIKLPEALGYDRNDITYQIPGVNHFVWMNEARLKGEPLFPILDQWLTEKAEDYWKTCDISAPLGKKRMDFYKKTRCNRYRGHHQLDWCVLALVVP